MARSEVYLEKVARGWEAPDRCPSCGEPLDDDDGLVVLYYCGSEFEISNKVVKITTGADCNKETDQ